MPLEVDVLQNEVVKVVGVPLVEGEAQSRHPLSLRDKGGFQVFAIHALDMSSSLLLTIQITVVERTLVGCVGLYLSHRRHSREEQDRGQE